jgi:hypothetical protein
VGALASHPITSYLHIVISVMSGVDDIDMVAQIARSWCRAIDLMVVVVVDGC